MTCPCPKHPFGCFQHPEVCGCADITKQPQYIIEGIILRRLHEKRIEGYTLEMAKEIADALALSRPTQGDEAT